MPDGVARTHEPDGRLVRRVRLQLIAWSAGSTLVVLVVLGAVIYGAIASSLATSSEQLLRNRAALMDPMGGVSGAGSIVGTSGSVQGGVVVGSSTVVTSLNASMPGFAMDGPYAGTLAVLAPADLPGTGPGVTPLVISADPNGQALSAGPSASGPGASGTIGLPDPDGYAAAIEGVTTAREAVYQGSPVRVLSVPVRAVDLATGADSVVGVIQVVEDRTSELRTLATLLIVLLGGGVLALVAATLVGSLYATRALVPIRASLQRQREFAADTSHELRTPLAVIRAGVARARQQPDATVAEVGGTLDMVDAEAVRLGALVDDLLALARTDAGAMDLELGDTDLAEVAADAMAPLQALAATRGTSLELDVAPAPLRGDAARLRRLVTVLVDNAIRHGREGGRVRVTARPGRLVVEDDGPGIPVEHRDRVFDRFWRGADSSAGGSGLGLAIASWIADRHGGRITVGDSRLGGASFEVRLPHA